MGKKKPVSTSTEPIPDIVPPEERAPIWDQPSLFKGRKRRTRSQRPGSVIVKYSEGSRYTIHRVVRVWETELGWSVHQRLPGRCRVAGHVEHFIPRTVDIDALVWRSIDPTISAQAPPMPPTLRWSVFGALLSKLALWRRKGG